MSRKMAREILVGRNTKKKVSFIIDNQATISSISIILLQSLEQEEYRVGGEVKIKSIIASKDSRLIEIDLGIIVNTEKEVLFKKVTVY